MTATAATPSYATTAFKGGVVAWLSAVTMLVASTDPTVRLIGAVGIVGLPALFMLCNAFVKRAALKQGGGGLLSLASSLLGALPSAAPAPPPAVPEVPTLVQCDDCGGKGVVGDLMKPEERKPCGKCDGRGFVLGMPR